MLKKNALKLVLFGELGHSCHFATSCLFIFLMIYAEVHYFVIPIFYRTNYKPGSITLYGMNLRTEPTTVTFPQFIPDIKLYLYMLEPVGKEGLKSQ